MFWKKKKSKHSLQVGRLTAEVDAESNRYKVTHSSGVPVIPETESSLDLEGTKVLAKSIVFSVKKRGTLKAILKRGKK